MLTFLSVGVLIISNPLKKIIGCTKLQQQQLFNVLDFRSYKIFTVQSNWVNYWQQNKGFVICFKISCYLCMSSFLSWLYFLVNCSIEIVTEGEGKKKRNVEEKSGKADGRMREMMPQGRVLDI